MDKNLRLFDECMTQAFIKFPNEDFSHVIILAHYPTHPDDVEFRDGVIQPVEWEIHNILTPEGRDTAERRVSYYRDRFDSVQVRGCSGDSLLRRSLSATV